MSKRLHLCRHKFKMLKVGRSGSQRNPVTMPEDALGSQRKPEEERRSQRKPEKAIGHMRQPEKARGS